MLRACYVYLQMIYTYLHVDSCGNAPIFVRESSSFLTQQHLSQLFRDFKRPLMRPAEGIPTAF